MRVKKHFLLILMASTGKDHVDDRITSFFARQAKKADEEAVYTKLAESSVEAVRAVGSSPAALGVSISVMGSSAAVQAEMTLVPSADLTKVAYVSRTSTNDQMGAVSVYGKPPANQMVTMPTPELSSVDQMMIVLPEHRRDALPLSEGQVAVDLLPMKRSGSDSVGSGDLRGSGMMKKNLKSVVSKIPTESRPDKGKGKRAPDGMVQPPAVDHVISAGVPHVPDLQPPSRLETDPLCSAALVEATLRRETNPLE